MHNHVIIYKFNNAQVEGYCIHKKLWHSMTIINYTLHHREIYVKFEITLLLCIRIYTIRFIDQMRLCNKNNIEERG